MSPRTFLLSLLLCTAALPTWGQREPEVQLAERYYESRDYERALALYERLYRAQPEQPAYAERAVECLQRLKRGDEALRLIERALRRSPGSIALGVLRAELLEAQGQEELAREQRQALVSALSTGEAGFEQVRALAGAFTARRRYVWAEAAYRQGRQLPGLEGAFGAELAAVLTADGRPAEAAREWLEMGRQSPNLWGAARQQILRLSTEASAPALERVLTQALNADPNNPALRELLADFYVQTENYAAALAQTRVLDRQRREGGQRLYQLAALLQQNGRYELSNQALEAVLRAAGDSPLAMNALVQRAKNFELSALAQRPVDSLRIRRAVGVYDSLFTQYGRSAPFAEALLRKARLCMAYTHDLPTAQQELETLSRLSLSDSRWAEAQLLLGDVLVMQGEYARARLVYEAVTTRLPEAPEAALAKLRDARLAYYKGDFHYARARLQVLKENPSTDVANDAIQLYLLIQDNLGLDSTTAALLPFARAQLLALQRRYPQALAVLDSVLTTYPGHPITDDVFWQKGAIRIEQGRVAEALIAYDLIVERYDRSVLADDALFAKAEAMHYLLRDTEAAQRLYLELLTRYPASLLGVEARRRIRLLRGEPGT